MEGGRVSILVLEVRLFRVFCFGVELTESRYVPGYLKELRDGHAEELALFKRQLNDVRTKMVRSLSCFPRIKFNLHLLATKRRSPPVLWKISYRTAGRAGTDG